MRILELLAIPHFTGPAERILALSQKIISSGHEVFIAVSTRPYGVLPEKVDDAGLNRVTGITLYRKWPRPDLFIRDLYRLLELCKSSNIQIISCHTSHDHWIARILSSLLKPSPIVVRTIHESRLLEPSFFRKSLYKSTNGFVLLGHEWSRIFKLNFPDNKGKILISSGLVDHERFKPDHQGKTAIRNELGISPDEFLLGLVGRIKRGRGQELLVRAVSDLINSGLPAIIILVGRGEGKEKLEKEVMDKGLSKNIRFLGYRRDDLTQVYSALDVACVLAEGSDGTCRSALEAMSCGVPVIAAPVGTLSETIIHEDCGWLMPDRNYETLLSFIKLAIRKLPMERQKMGENARKRILETYTVEKVCINLLPFYEGLLKDRAKEWPI